MFIGIDLGTSSVKVVLIDVSGHVVAEEDASYPMYGESVGLCEQNPEDWISAISFALDSLREKVSGENWQSIKGIGLSAQMPTMVILSDRGEVIGPSIVWCDQRAEEQGKKLLKIWGKDRHYKETGVKLDGRYILPMYKWMKENKPELLLDKHRILSAKDYLYYWLSGKITTDPSTASGFALYNLKTGDWDSQLCAEALISKDLLPPINDSLHIGANLKGEIRYRFGFSNDVYICNGSADSVAGVLGMGAIERGTVCQMCGSSTAIIAICDNIITKPDNKFFITPLIKTGTFGLEADILSTGRTSNWLANIIDKNVADLSNLADKAAPGSEGVVFTPYLSGGEQSVLWDTALFGSVMGLSSGHDISHIVRAHYEGICFETKRCIDTFTETGFRVKKMLMGGPVTKDQFFMQLTADILGCECIVSNRENASAYGAAMAAGIGTGHFIWDFSDHQPMGDGKAYRPNKALNKKYAAYYERYLKISSVSKY